MKALRSGLWAQAVLAAALLLYGLFYHISFSEFWPITISKTWFTPDHFEYSQLQKPLFTLFLSLFHLLPLNDVQHLYLVKLVFSALGVLSLFVYAEVLQKLAGVSLSRYARTALITAIVLLSPVLLQNFFRIRSDQMTFLFFVLVLYFNLQGRVLHSLACLILIPMISIKGVLFLLPGGLIIVTPYLGYIKKIPKVWRLNLILTALGAVIWAIGLNLPALTYFLDTYDSNYFPNYFLKEYFQQEGLFLLAGLGVALYGFYRRTYRLPYMAAALICGIYILAAPQSYPYFIASLSPLVYLPLLTLTVQAIATRSQHKVKLLTLSGLQLGILAVALSLSPVDLYRSSQFQFRFLEKASRFLSAHPLNYLDGMGILPRQNLIPCFVSPDDDIANNGCRSQIHSDPAPDVLLITQRLSFLGNETFQFAEKNYTQVLPNFWVHRRHQELIRPEDVDMNLPPPMLIFSF